MLKYIDLKPIFFIFANIIFAHILSELNSEVAPHIYFVVPALFIVPSALLLNFLPMLFSVAFTAFFFEASTPVRAGSTVAMWLFVAYIVHTIRHRFIVLDWFSLSALYILANFALLLLYFIFFPKQADSVGTYIVRTATDTLCSSALLMLVGKFCITIPILLANLCGMELSIREEK
jgi:hypothetical protein